MTEIAIKVSASDETKPKLNIIDVVLKLDWKDKCPICGKPVKVVWTSTDGKVKAYKCVKGHMKKGVRDHPVWLVRD